MIAKTPLSTEAAFIYPDGIVSDNSIDTVTLNSQGKSTASTTVGTNGINLLEFPGSSLILKELIR